MKYYSGDRDSWTEKKLTLILCVLEFKTITTCDSENLTAQISHDIEVHASLMWSCLVEDMYMYMAATVACMWCSS